MGNINKLSQHLVNKIAAGEVIERPASVVKELVENSIDAGATRIDIVIEEGGKKLIQVTDNGKGMTAEDVPLAFAPHATSKISEEDDLFNIATMGFRGEALASIASISHASIRTYRPGEQTGWHVSATGQHVGSPAPSAAPAGTTIEIRNLFFNTPARRKFLKTNNTEFGHITEQIIRAALPNPDIAFTVRHNNRQTMNLPAVESTQERIADIFTRDLAEALLPMTERTGEVSIAGYTGTPAAARSSTKWQYVFLNGRYIRDRLISHALREAYRGLLMPVKSPVVFIFIEIDPADVDVNVHPTKIEVRFKDSNRVYGELLASLKETLFKSDLRPDADAGQAKPLGQSPTEDQSKRTQSMREALADFFKKAPAPQPRLGFTGDPIKPAATSSQNQHTQNSITTDADGFMRATSNENPSDFQNPGNQYQSSQPMRPASGVHFTRESIQQNSANLASQNYQSASQGQLPHQQTASIQAPSINLADQKSPTIMQVHNTYIVAQTSAGMIIVDQHALHERILYNQFQARILQSNLATQQMLIPETLSVTESEIALIDQHGQLFDKLGFELVQFGPSSLAINRYPTLLAERKVKMAPFLRELFDKISEDELASPEEILDEVLSMMSCKAAIKAGQPLSVDEMKELLASAEGVEKKTSCPHGRPTILQMSVTDLEKQFKRI